VRRLLILAVSIFLIAPQIAQACTGSINWTGAKGDGYWTTPGNWDLNRLPGMNDDVCIGGGFSVSNPDSSGVGPINSLTLEGSLTLNDTALTLNSTSATSTIKDLTLKGPLITTILVVNGKAEFIGNLTLSDGGVQGPGTATIMGAVTVLKGQNAHAFIVTNIVDNKGSITVTENGVQLTLGISPGTFTNEASASINLQGDGINILGGTTFNNSGTIVKTTGSGASNFTETTGTFTHKKGAAVLAQSGTLIFSALGSSAGEFGANSGATLQFANQMTLNAGTTLTGSGTLDITLGGLWDVEAPITVQTSQLTFDGQTGTLIRGNSDLTIKSVTVTWNSGVISGAANSKVTLTKAVTMQILTTGLHGLQERNLNLFGTVNMNADLELTPSTVTIEAGATFNIQTDNGIHGQGTINNGGRFEKTGGSQTSTVDCNGSFNIVPNGTITVSSGTLDLAAGLGGALTGTMTVNAGATLEFSAGTYTLAQGTTFKGAGSTLLTVANWTLDGDAAVNTDFFGFDGQGFNAGVIGGSSNLSVTSRNFIWIGGWMQGNGSTTISAKTKLTINTGKPALIGWVVDNFGTTAITDSSSALTVGGALWNNHTGSSFDFQSDGSVLDNGNGSSTFTNDGTVQKTQGTATSSVAFTGTFNNNGKVIAEGGGELSLSTSSGTSTGAWIAKGNSEIKFDGGNWTINQGTTMTGGGEIANAATWILGAALVVQSETFGDFGDVHTNFDFRVESPVLIVDLARIFGGQEHSKLPASGCSLTIPKATTKIQARGLSLTSCTFDNSASVQITGSSGSLSLNTSSALLNEASGKITLDMPTGSNVAAIAGDSSSTVTNSGLIKLGTDSGANTTQTISTQGSFSNSGSISVPAKRTLDLSSLTQTGGATSVAKGGTLAAGGTLTISGGTIGGSGTITGPANNTGGTIEAGSGNVTGKLALNAAETQGASSAMTALISGTTAGKQYDQINNTSSESLSGTLNLQFGNGFTPAPTDSFNILNFSSVTGAFSTVNAPAGWTANLKFKATSLNVQFSKNGISVSINPKAAMVKVSGMTQFTSTIAGASRNGETWSVKEGGGGAVTQTGLYTAPATPGTYHVVVTSVADLTKSATATVTVTALDADRLTVTPQAAVLQPGAVLRLQANQSVVWSVAEGRVGGSVTAAGSYTAPQKPGLYRVVATRAEGSNHAVANIAVAGGKLQSAYVANLDKNSVSVFAGVASNGLTTGQLRPTESVVTGQRPVGLAISPDGKLLLSANNDSKDVSVFAISHEGGPLGMLPRTSYGAGVQPSAAAFDPSGRLVFVTNQGSDDVSVFSVDASGQLTFLRSHALAVGDSPSAIAVDPGGSVVYLTSAGSNTVQGFAYDAAGTLKPIPGSPFATGTSPSAVMIDPAGKFLFVANRGSGDVSVFAIDVKHETLQEVDASPFQAGKGAAALATDITGSYLFVADHEANDIASFQIDPETGALTAMGRTPLAAAGPCSLAMDPSGQYLYVTSDRTAGVATLKVDVASGALSHGANTQSPGKGSAIVLSSSDRATAQHP
jgi:6-phosphogluconolactonase (cycloisomerase 2 family)